MYALLIRMIITAKLDSKSQTFFSRLRKQHFPEERNFIDAHLTLFHHVPEELREKLPRFTAPLRVVFRRVFFLGKGFAVEAECAELDRWRREVLKLPFEFTAQDRAHKRLHITIQNKVEPALAKINFRDFEAGWVEMEGEVLGLEFWNYLGGPWSKIV